MRETHMRKARKWRRRQHPFQLVQKEKKRIQREFIQEARKRQKQQIYPVYPLIKRAIKDEKNIENEGETPVSNILRLGEEREKSLNVEEKDWNMTERYLKRRETLQFILNGECNSFKVCQDRRKKIHIKNIHLSPDNLSEEGENVPETSHNLSWISLAVRENVVHSQEEESEIVTNQNNFQFLNIPAMPMPDHIKYMEKLEMDNASPDYLLDDEKYRMGELSFSNSKITEEDKELEIQEPVDNNRNTERENNHKEESVSIVVLPRRRRTLSESNEPNKTTCKSFCIEFAAICCVLPPYVNIFFILSDQTLNIRVLLLYVEVLFDLMLCGAFTDSQGEEAAEEVNIASFFGEGGPPDGVLDNDGKIVDLERYQKFLKKEKIKHIIGYIVAILVICVCITYINLQSAVFGTTVSYKWFFTWLFRFLFDTIIILPLNASFIMFAPDNIQQSLPWAFYLMG